MKKKKLLSFQSAVVMLAPQVVPRVMSLVVDQMKKLLQKVTFVKSNKLSFQLLKLIGFHK